MLKKAFQNHLGLALRAERKAQRFTQANVAKKAGVSIPTIRLLERGRGTLRVWNLALTTLQLTLCGKNLPPGTALGKQVAALRRRRGLGQRPLSDIIGISQPTLVKLERQSEGSLATLDRALTALGAGPKLVRHGESVKFYTHTNTSSAHHNWSTPKDLLEILYQVFDRFDLDPCSPSSNPRRSNVRARVHYTMDDDGLSLPWYGNVFLNPPYGRTIPDWTAKAKSEVQSGNAAIVVAVLPARTDTNWWHRDIASVAVVLFLRGRLSFGDSGQSAPFPSALVVWGGTLGQLATLQRALPRAWTPQVAPVPAPDPA